MVWRNLSCRFLKAWGCDAYVKRFQVDKLEPKADKMHLHRTPKNSWVYLLFQIWKQKRLFLELGPFSRKSFSWKNWVGGWLRLDEVIEPSLQLVCSRAQEGTTSCALPHTSWRDGSITSSSFHHPPTQFFREKLFLEKGPDSRNNPLLLSDLRQEACPTVFGLSYEDVFIRFGFELIRMKLFSHKRRSPKLSRNDSLGFSKP